MKEKQNIPEWLKNLQENSWELELLISGGAVFTLLKASDFLLESVYYLKMTTAFPLGAILLVAMFGLKLLTFGFILHLLLRAFWVAMVFINFVFPKGVDNQKIKFKKPFRANIDERSDLYNPIMKIDKLSGIVMFLSIIYSVVIFGLILLLITFLSILTYAFDISFLAPIFLFSFVIYIFDLFSFGLLRKIKFVSYIFYPIFKLYDFISLRFLYKKPLMVYSTNIKKVKAIFFTFIFMLVVLVSTYVAIQQTMSWPNLFDKRVYRQQLADNPSISGYYEDENPEAHTTLPSKIIKDNYLELKCNYWRFENRYIDLLDKPENEKLFSDIIQVSIDDSIYNNVEWFPYRKKEHNIFGVKAMLPISGYPLKVGQLII